MCTRTTAVCACWCAECDTEYPAHCCSCFKLGTGCCTRHRFTDIRLTRKRFATSRSLAPSSISTAAANRTYHEIQEALT
jgi:hypothetical protein